ncbi:sugar O-acetyltransferase [Demequina aurantiaca]|uniref:sugar O-acetyltransferase n=1 Tax=Demequina aurantiaca TaxID=676200 RepID=UPI000781465E|nr:maltose acetyltransferase domain-containing protein [Demequina aurantiaca]
MTETPDLNDGRTMRERMEAGDLYRGVDDDMAAAMRGARARASRYGELYDRDRHEATVLLHELLGHVGDDVDIRPPLHVDYGSNISIGSGTFANFGLMALDVAAITIGQDVQMGPNVQLLTPTHPVEADLRRDKWEAAEPIVIGDNVWLGGGVIVCPGVTIGENTVVGAGSVVVKDLPANVVAVGSPARVVRNL